MTKVSKVPGHSKYRHSTKFPVPPLELPRTLSQILSVLGTQNTESVKKLQVKSSTVLLKTHLSSYEALSQKIKAFFSLI